MGCSRYLIQPVVALYGFCVFMSIPLLQQYVYARLWERRSGAPYSASQNTQCANSSANLTSTYMEVQKEASVFLLSVELCFLVPSMFSSPLLVSASDSWGRKAAIVPPVLGNLLLNTCCFLISHFSLDLRLLLAAAFLSGLLGAPAALLGACFAYVADRCREGERVAAGASANGSEGGVVGGVIAERAEDNRSGSHLPETSGVGPSRRRTMSMASLDLILGLIAGLAPACTGVFIYVVGFSWPFLLASLLHLLNLAYVLLILRESFSLSVTPLVSSSSSSTSTSTSSSSCSSWLRGVRGSGLWGPVRGQLQSVHRMFVMGSRRRNTALGLVLATFALFKLCKDGGMSTIILYQLNRPLCWSELLIGCASLLGTTIHLGSYAGVSLFSRCLGDANVVLLGLLSLAAGLLMAAFANTTLLMFLVRVPLLLSDMPGAVLRSMTSGLVPGSEQGTMFACVVLLEMLSLCVALAVFNSTYAATVSWFSGFSFLLASLLVLVPALLIGVLKALPRDREEDTESLTAEGIHSSQSLTTSTGAV